MLNRDDPLAVNSFLADSYASRIARVPGVAAVEPTQSEYVNVGDRRVWLTARAPADTRRLLEEQVVEGDPRAAVMRLEQGGWAVISEQLAAEHHARVGDSVLFSTPTGNRTVKVAAATTNFGWSPGAILMSSREHAQLGQHRTDGACVHLIRGANVERVRRAIAAALGPNSGLEAISARQRAQRFLAIAREGLAQLADIALLLTLAAILALAAALGSAIWQRRASLAAMRITAAPPSAAPRPGREGVLMLAAGCLTGTVGGLYGQAVIDSYLKRVTGFPVAGITASWQPLELLGIVALAVLALLTWPVVAASRVEPELALDE